MRSIILFFLNLNDLPESGKSTFEGIMRLLCVIQGHRFKTIKEEWIEPKNQDDLLSLLRFDECSHCLDVRATLTHPEDYKTRWSIATKMYHRTISSDKKNLQEQ